MKKLVNRCLAQRGTISSLGQAPVVQRIGFFSEEDRRAA